MRATIGRVLGLSLAGLLAAGAIAQNPPPAKKPLAPPASREPAAVVFHAPQRYDDLLWENDRVAFRIYGPALEKQEPPSGSGIDAWGKRVRWPWMERQLATGDYHADLGEGQDFYGVKLSRGAGGLGIWQDNKLWNSRNWERHRILDKGPTVAKFEVDYAPWPVGVGRTVRETRRFELPLGINLTRMTSTITSSSNEPLVVGIGIGKTLNPPTAGELTVDRARGIMSFWEPENAEHGSMGIAVVVDPKMITDVTADYENHLVLVRVTPGKPFVYYSGATWSRGLQLKTKAEWEAWLRAQQLDFDPAKS